jgi:plastocyanin
MARGSIIRLTLAAAAFALITVACASGGSAGEVSSVDGPTVAVHDYAFEPAALTVEPGVTITWVWEGRAPHNVIGEGFQSEDQSSGTFRHTFEQVGTYRYECTIHPGMEGSVVVEAS